MEKKKWIKERNTINSERNVCLQISGCWQFSTPRLFIFLRWFLSLIFFLHFYTIFPLFVYFAINGVLIISRLYSILTFNIKKRRQKRFFHSVSLSLPVDVFIFQLFCECIVWNRRILLSLKNWKSCY